MSASLAQPLKLNEKAKQDTFLPLRKVMCAKIFVFTYICALHKKGRPVLPYQIMRKVREDWIKKLSTIYKRYPNLVIIIISVITR